MDAGLPGVEPEAHGQIAPTVGKTRRKPSKRPQSRENPARSFRIVKFGGFLNLKSDRLLVWSTQPRGFHTASVARATVGTTHRWKSCWDSLKTELVHHCRFATREQAKREITEYIEIFYNRIREQARLGHLSPTAFSQQYYAMQMAA